MTGCGKCAAVLAIALTAAAVECSGVSQGEIASYLDAVVPATEVIAAGVVVDIDTMTITTIEGYGQTQSLITLAVSRVFKASLGDEVVFRTHGGTTADGSTVRRVGRRNFAENDTCVVFLHVDQAEELFFRGGVYFFRGDNVLSKSAVPIDLSADELWSEIEAAVERHSFASAVSSAPLIVEGIVHSLVDNRFDGEGKLPRYLIGLTALAVHKGALGDSVMQIAPSPTPRAWRGTPEFRIGEHVMLALAPREDGTFDVVGGAAGKMTSTDGTDFTPGPTARIDEPLPYWYASRADKVEHRPLARHCLTDSISSVLDER